MRRPAALEDCQASANSDKKRLSEADSRVICVGRLRETIFAVLPIWFKDEAAQICHQTLEKGGGKPLVQRVADMRIAFEALGVTGAQLETKRGRRIDDFLAEDVAALGVIYRSLKHGEITLAEEFPKEGLSPSTGSKLDTLEQMAKTGSGTEVDNDPTHEAA